MRLIILRLGDSVRSNMQVNAGKLQILTVAAMLVLVSGGIAAYAQNQYAPSSGTPSAAAPGASAAHDDNSTSSMFASTDTTTTFSTSTSTTSTISSTSTTTSANHTLCQPPSTGKVGRLVLPITANGSSAGGSISFAFSKGCFASITTVGGIFNVDIALRHANAVTQYLVVLVANGTSYTLGNMVTGRDGAGAMQNQVLLKTGTYVVSIQIFDTSSNPGHSTLVLQTGQATIVSPPFPTADSGQQSNQGSKDGQGDKGESGNHK
jgi:hypothetical protein